jgi:hypothetical protein
VRLAGPPASIFVAVRVPGGQEPHHLDLTAGQRGLRRRRYLFRLHMPGAGFRQSLEAPECGGRLPVPGAGSGKHQWLSALMPLFIATPAPPIYTAT